MHAKAEHGRNDERWATDEGTPHNPNFKVEKWKVEKWKK